MTNRRLIEMIRGWAKAGDSMPIAVRAAQPRVTRALGRASLGLAAAGIACVGFASFGGGLLEAAGSAAVSGGGAYGSGGSDASVSGLAASAPVEVVDLAAAIPIEASPLQGAVGEPAAPVTPPAPVAAPRTVVARAPLPPPAPGSVEATITEVFGAHAAAAIGVARCESHLNPGAISRNGGNWGLFQINKVHSQRVARMGFQWEDLLDARVNALVAKSIFDEQGWGPWACRHAAT
jgi:hypothetical protein